MAKRRANVPAASPMTRLSQRMETADLNNSTSGSDAGLSQDASSSQQPASSQRYCTPEFMAHDFCTPDDQVQDLNWSQPDPSAEPAGFMCPPTPDSAMKRRKTRPSGARDNFMYDLPETDEQEEDIAEERAPPVAAAAATFRPPLPRPPAKKGAPFLAPQAPMKGRLAAGAKQTTLEDAWRSQPPTAISGSPSGSPSSSPAKPRAAASRCSWPLRVGGTSEGTSSRSGRSLGAAACYTNSFLSAESLTAAERKTPSRPVPLLDRSIKASRYLTDFEELSQLGKGSFGTVFLSRSRTDGCTYAVKKSTELVRTDGGKRTLLKEVFAMAALAGVQHVVRYHSAWYDCDQLYIQMEACDGTLAGRFLSPKGGRADDQTLFAILHQIGTALAGMHEKGMSHLDVKPENIYYKGESNFRLGDFGITHSEAMVAEGKEPMEGDGRYIAPELIQGLSQGFCLSLHPCDIFALGVTILELASGTPIDRHAPPLSPVLAGLPLALPGRAATSPLMLILSGMLHLRAEVRPSAAGVAGDAAQERVESCGEEETLQGLREALASERRKREAMERSVEALAPHGEANNGCNASVDASLIHDEGSRASMMNESMRSDAEPCGSQEVPESPLRFLGQTMVV
ncbi:kinase-like domain-containing protein [Baffinella frigidus]|nr:kinase-like domain-containing protein [Cryptophyta sp. CCMP2293]